MCQFGVCSRLEDNREINFEFDLIYRGENRKGFVGFEYKNLDKSVVLDYIFKAKDFPFSILVTASLAKNLKSAILWDANSDQKRRRTMVEVTPEVSEQLRINMEKANHGISIYSCFYERNEMKIVPLIEYDEAKGVLIIIQTNFGI